VCATRVAGVGNECEDAAAYGGAAEGRRRRCSSGRCEDASKRKRGCESDRSFHGTPSRCARARFARGGFVHAKSLPHHAAVRDASERNPYEEPAADDTYAATSWICCSESWPLNDGITPLPFV